LFFALFFSISGPAFASLVFVFVRNERK
jgi:hypothetical protein